MTWADERVLVTGATGFIGARLCGRLAALGAPIWGTVFEGDDPERADGLPPSVKRVPLQITDPASVSTVIGAVSPTIVLHLAAAGVADPGIEAAEALEVNAGGAANLLAALRGRPVSRIVLIGTCHEYGGADGSRRLDPSNVYAASKVAAWAIGRAFWHAYDLPIVTVRPFQVYGPGQPGHALVPSAISAALADRDFPMTGGDQERDFIFVDDVVDGMVASAAAAGVEGESIDLGTGMARTVRDVVEMIWTMTGSSGRLCVGAMPYRRGEASRLSANADRTARLTGWRAGTCLRAGLQRTINDL